MACHCAATEPLHGTSCLINHIATSPAFSCLLLSIPLRLIAAHMSQIYLLTYSVTVASCLLIGKQWSVITAKLFKN